MMKKFSFFVGLDMGKSKFSAAFRRDAQVLFAREYSNDVTGISALLKDLQRHDAPLEKTLVALEHCGVYLDQLVRVLYGEGIFVWVWNPMIAKHAPLELNRSKTDLRDAQSMAQLAELYQVKAVQFVPQTPQEAELKTLFVLRKQLIKKRTQCFNQLDANQCKAIPNLMAKSCLEKQVELFNSQIHQIEKQLEKLIFTQARFKRIYLILISIPGIGPVTATQMIYITQAFTAFQSHKQLAKFIGTLPLEYTSGTSIRKKPRSSKRAHKELKVNLTMGALASASNGAFFHDFYQFQRKKRNKEHLIVINTIRNIILKLAFTLVKKDQIFDPALYSKNKISWQNHLTLP